MPKVSLVVCLRGERDLLARLLKCSNGCYDHLVVIHDGPVDCRDEKPKRISPVNLGPTWQSPEELSLPSPAPPPKAIAIDYAELPPAALLPNGYRKVENPLSSNGIPELVSSYGGHLYEGPRCFQQEPHWPFAWSRAAHDWILRLDADEFPSDELCSFLQSFRAESFPAHDLSGFTCVWPFWDGERATTHNWPNDRLFLFDRRKVRFFGMAEQAPIPLGPLKHLPVILHHQPHGKRYGLRKVILRSQAGKWRRVIAESLVGSPLELPRWQWNADNWPIGWENLRRKPIKESFARLILIPLYQARAMMGSGNSLNFSACVGSAVQHFLIGLLHWQVSRRKNRAKAYDYEPR